jgi:hypothetical protein
MEVGVSGGGGRDGLYWPAFFEPKIIGGNFDAFRECLVNVSTEMGNSFMEVRPWALHRSSCG